MQAGLLVYKIDGTWYTYIQTMYNDELELPVHYITALERGP